jgi:hypothetical protein
VRREIERAVGLVEGAHELAWHQILLRREVQLNASQELCYGVGLVNGVALALGVPVHEVVRDVRHESGAPLLRHPPRSAKEVDAAGARARGWADCIERDYSVPEPGWTRLQVAYVEMVEASAHTGIGLNRLPPPVERDITQQLKAGAMPDDAHFLAAYRSGWTHAAMSIIGGRNTPASVAASAPEPPAPPRRRVVDVARKLNPLQPRPMIGPIPPPGYRPCGNPPWREP